ncbi:MAG: AAA family ATPase [Clostridia bacterium]
MQRIIVEDLKKWKNNADKKPLIIYGARQVGKTYSAVKFGKENYDNTVYFNFEGNKALCSIFDLDLNPNRIITELSAFCSQKINKQNTLIIFDEIQASEKALTSLKYFCEEAPEYNIIAAGSLLGLAVNRGSYSFPVGKVDILTMYPLTFKEFLWATEKDGLIALIENAYKENSPLSEALHAQAMELYRTYLIVGGMPAAVNEFVNKKDFDYVKIAQNAIYNAYTSDMTKYSTQNEAMKTAAVYDSIPYQLARENNKFQYNLIKSGARASAYEFAMEWLKKAGIVIQCAKTREGKMPLEFYKDATAYKIYMSDVGMLTAKSNYSPALILSNAHLGGEAKGALTENYIAQELFAKGNNLFYWESDGKAEVDFVVQLADKVVPIESKAAENVKSKSFDLFRKKYSIDCGIRISAKNFGLENGIKSVPLYAVFCI